MFSLGIDIGYASVKMALIDENGAIQSVRYQLHKGDGRGVVRRFLEEMDRVHPLSGIGFGAATGSGAGILQGPANIRSVNEVAALVEGASRTGPRARSMIEIGGQSAKYLTGLGARDRAKIQVAMNSNCSAGTGSFLEEQVSRLNLKLEDYSAHAAKAKTIPRIAGRCSVFAKTDITHHQQEGVPAADILLGLAFAAVRNYRVSVFRKLPREEPILLAGGVAHNQGVLTALMDVLGLQESGLIIPEHMDSLGALGAALIAAADRLPLDVHLLLDGLDRPLPIELNHGTPLPPLAGFGRDDGIGKHEIPAVAPGQSILDCYLGVDIGSTSTNLVLTDPDDRLMAYRYMHTRGDPVKAVRSGLASLKKEFGDRLNVLGACTTGSGRYMIGRLIGADRIKDEITSQARAAAAIDPSVETIFEIGGQDSKYIHLEDGLPTDFQMNKICAAGTGSFLEEQAKKFDLPLSEIGAMALASDHPINLGERCTVFMESSIAEHLGRGANVRDLTAGLCYSVVKNYLNRVVGRKKVGDKVFFQGGTAFNQGVVNAFRSLTGKDIQTPPFFSVTGAYGAAILAREAGAGRSTSFKGFEPAVEKVIPKGSGRATDRPEASAFSRSMEDLIFEGYTGDRAPDRKTVGIPRALFTFGMFSMFFRLFRELGFNVLLSEPSSEKTIALGQEYSLDETCYPVKLINGHVAELVDKKVDYIFFPDLFSVDHPGSPSRRNYGCAYMQLAFKMVNQAMDLRNKGVGLLAPTIAFDLGPEFMMNRFSDLGRRLGKSPEETARALQKGVQAFHDFEARMARAGREAMRNLDPNKKTFVLISKIYGAVDPVLNMGVPDRLMEMDCQVVPFFFLPEGDLSKEHPNMYWPFVQHILEPAQLIRERPDLQAVLLTHHGCGPDGATAHYFREEMRGKPYLHIEVDEHSSRVGVLTRVEAFVNSLENRIRRRSGAGEADSKNGPHKDENISNNVTAPTEGQTLYLPCLHPHAHVLRELIASKGIAAEVLPPTSRDTADLGRTFTLVEEYFSFTALLGDVFGRCRAQPDGAPAAFLIPRNEGAELDGQYSRLLRMKLDEEGYADAVMVSPFLEDLLDADEADVRALFLGLLAGDLVQAAPLASRSDRLESALDLCRGGRPTIEAMAALAEDIRREARGRSWLKRLYIVGEPLVLYNDYLNDFLFRRIEEQGHRVLYAPLSEAMWLFWRDHNERYGRSKRRRGLLEDFAENIRVISERLGVEGPFEKDPSDLVGPADEIVGYYAGAFGRFRGAKALAEHERVQGIITASSTYENTGISLNILGKALARPGSRPILDLTFDGNRRESDFIKCDSFIHYL